ncbi:MAG: redox-regulated ATPase YchF [Clostridiales bacterium]|nr:redox-regulated ATPase YchF [Clostridiales bacterium]
MALSCGLIGLPLTGKTTFFNLLTGAQQTTSAFSSGKTAASTGHVLVPDSRIDYLSALFKPKKTTYAQLEIIDIPGLIHGAGNEFLTAVRETDALAHIVRGFENDDVLHIEDSIGVMRDIDAVAAELLLADLQLIETRLQRIQGGAKKKLEHPLEEAALEKCQTFLLNEQPLSALTFTEEEQEALKHITFLTTKPLLIVVNLDEDQFSSGNWLQKEQVEKYCSIQGYELLPISARLEEEISRLPVEERGLFLDELGITESGVSRLSRALYRQLGLVSFLTAGTDEVKAWTIKSGLPAKLAAGKIHSDIERGFIRAETVAFSHLEESGSMAAAREKGYFRLEGKTYPVQDGDIINFRFNI